MEDQELNEQTLSDIEVYLDDIETKVDQLKESDLNDINTKDQSKIESFIPSLEKSLTDISEDMDVQIQQNQKLIEYFDNLATAKKPDGTPEIPVKADDVKLQNSLQELPIVLEKQNQNFVDKLNDIIVTPSSEESLKAMNQIAKNLDELKSQLENLTSIQETYNQNTTNIDSPTNVNLKNLELTTQDLRKYIEEHENILQQTVTENNSAIKSVLNNTETVNKENVSNQEINNTELKSTLENINMDFKDIVNETVSKNQELTNKYSNNLTDVKNDNKFNQQTVNNQGSQNTVKTVDQNFATVNSASFQNLENQPATANITQTIPNVNIVPEKSVTNTNIATENNNTTQSINNNNNAAIKPATIANNVNANTITAANAIQAPETNDLSELKELLQASIQVQAAIADGIQQLISAQNTKRWSQNPIQN